MEFPRKSVFIEHKHCYDEFEVDEWREALRKRLQEILEVAEAEPSTSIVINALRSGTSAVAREVLEWLKGEGEK